MRAQRLCRPLDEAAARAVAALLVHALPRGGGSAALCAVARQPGARDRQGRRGGRRARQRQADGLCGKLYPRNRIGMSHGRVRGQAHDRWSCRDDRRQEARRALRDQALHQIRLRVELRRWQPAAACARHPVRSPRRQGASHQALRAIHENGGGQSRQRLEAHGRRDRCLRPRPFATTMINPSGRSSMTLSRRSLLKSAAAVGALATSAEVFAPAIAQNKPVRIGILAPRSGIAAAPGENGIRATQWAVERFNAGGGIAGRKIELVIEEESSPKDTIERFGKLVQQEKVDCVQGIISTGAGLALGPVVEEARALTIYWDVTTQDGVDEKIPNPRYLFRSTDNECEAIMSSLLAIKYWKGKFASVAGINPDYSYGRNNMAAFVAMLKRFNIEHKVVTEQWPKVGTMDLTSPVAALNADKPELLFPYRLFRDLPVESLGGKGSWRKDHIAEQTFVQGLTTHNNKYDFVTLGSFETMYASDLQKPPGANFWEWIKTAKFNI